MLGEALTISHRGNSLDISVNFLYFRVASCYSIAVIDHHMIFIGEIDMRTLNSIEFRQVAGGARFQEQVQKLKDKAKAEIDRAVRKSLERQKADVQLDDTKAREEERRHRDEILQQPGHI